MDITYRFDPYEPLVPRSIETSAEAVELLRTGHSQFIEIQSRLQAAALGNGPRNDVMVIPSSPVARGMSLVQGAAAPQQPFAIVLSCSDARVPIEELFQVHANSVFVIRVAGSIIGTEILASISYALHNFRNSVKLLVVLGHSGCGAVTAAVDSFLQLDRLDEVVSNYAIRSLIDRLLLSVRLASQTQSGDKRRSAATWRTALIESTCFINAALSAFQLREVLRIQKDNPVKVMFGSFDLRTNVVQSMPHLDADSQQQTFLAEAPCDSSELLKLAVSIGKVFEHLPDAHSLSSSFVMPPKT